MNVTTAVQPSAQTAQRSLARRLAETVEQAVDRGLFEQANRLANAGRPLAVHSSRLTDRLARLYLAHQQPDKALQLIDACTSRPDSLRMLRAVCLVQCGRVAEAHLDLNEWAGKSTAPLVTRRLLGLIETAIGNDDAAKKSLLRNLHHADDPATLEQLLVMSIKQSRPEQAEHWLHRLLQASLVNHGNVDGVVLCESLGLVHDEAVAPSPSQVHVLAMELVSQPEALSELVEHQQRSYQPIVASLVYEATRRALPEVERPTPFVEALARLAAMLGRRGEAIHWARRGVAENPMSVPLNLILSERTGSIDDDAAPTDNEQTRKAA